eukprot:7384952-Prymnesium_polylepis.1
MPARCSAHTDAQRRATFAEDPVCCKKFPNSAGRSEHKSKCKQFIQACGQRPQIRVSSHAYEAGGMSWQFLRTQYQEKQNF